MYKNRKFGKNVPSKKDSNKRPLNTIDEDTTIKLPVNKRQMLSTEAVISYNNNESTANDCAESSEENIPASQEQTQRYLSQRSCLAATLGRTQSRSNCTTRPPNSYFELVLMKAGVELDQEESFVLSCDHVTFVHKLRQIFLRAQNYPENVQTFKAGLTTALDPKSKLAIKLLSSCIISAPGEDEVFQSQSSMFTNFLLIDFLRDAALDVLLDKIDDAARCLDRITICSEQVLLLPLMLTQLRYVTTTHSEQIFKRLKDVFVEATDAAKADIIGCSEYILDASKHDEFTEMLIENYSQTQDLFSMDTIQALTNLSLSTKMQYRLRARIVAFIKDDKCPNKTLPCLIQFMLKVLNEDTDETMRELVETLRDIFQWRIQSPVTTSSSNNIENGMNTNKQEELELFKFIEQGLTRSKRFYNTWQKTIASLPPTQFKSFDFVILLVLISIREDNSLYIENILRRRIKSELITIDILEEVTKHFACILQQKMNILMRTLGDFMREKQKLVSDFAKSAYSLLFKFCDSIQKEIIKKLLELTCDQSAQHMVNVALQLIKDLQRKYPKEVQNWGMLLMPLLDRLNEMTLSQTRLIMEILCSIAFPPPSLTECPALQDQIDMVVKKQLINRAAFVKKQGIIGSVQLIDRIARTVEKIDGSQTSASAELNESYNSVGDLPDGRGKIAANCIVRTQMAARDPETLALFYDELASACSVISLSGLDARKELHLDKAYIIWLCELMTYYFQTNFIAEREVPSVSGIPLEFKKCLNSNEDITNNSEAEDVLSIGVRIAELVLKPTGNPSTSILVMAPVFNILRTLQLLRFEGSLESINALLGCAIVLPKFFDDATPDSIHFDYDVEQQKQILDIYFHTANWMRVIICAFASQREPRTRRKVLIRLADLIQIEQKIKLILMTGPREYVPPQSQFNKSPNSAAAKQGGGGVRGKPANAKHNRTFGQNKTSQNTTVDMTLNDLSRARGGNNTPVKLAAAGKNNKSNRSTKIDYDNLYGPRERYRQLGTDLMLLLHEKFSLKYPMEADDIGKQFGLLEFRFILTDLVNKLDSVVGTTNMMKTEGEIDCQYVAKPVYFISDLSRFLPIICKNTQMLFDELNTQLVNVNFVYSNCDLFTEHYNYMKCCFGLCLRLLSSYFSWAGFNDEAHEELLRKSLLAILPSKESQKDRNNKTKLASEVFDFFIKYEVSVVHLGTAVQLQQFLYTIRRLGITNEAERHEQLQEQAQKIRKLCRTMLCRKWYNYEGTMDKGAQCNTHLDGLVKGFLKDSDMKRQREIIGVLLNECSFLNGKDGVLKSFPNFTKANFPMLFRGLCETLINSLNEMILRHYGADKLKMWENSCSLFNLLLEIVHKVEQPRNFLLFLKHSHIYVKLMLQHGLTLLEDNLRSQPERVIALLKSLQQITRFLHNLCCHSKAIKNLTIINQIPVVRETVENFVFRVKAMLAANKCHDVFWMGNLVNKDLHGSTLVSENCSLPNDRNEEGEDSDAEMPEDDASLEESVLPADADDNSSIATTRNSATTLTRLSSRSKCI